MEGTNFIPPQFGPVFGTAVHTAFATTLRLGGVPGVEVEQSFYLSDVADYGVEGSIRTDAVLRSEGGDIIAIYDVKTGGLSCAPRGQMSFVLRLTSVRTCRSSNSILGAAQV